MRILALTTYPSEDASRRLRFDPLIAKLSQRNQVRVHSLMTTQAFRLKNRRFGRYFAGLVVAVRCIQRLVLVVAGRYDGLVVHREAFPFFTPTVERLVAARARVSLVDVDDAIYEAPTHGRDWRRYFRAPHRARAYPDLFDIVSVASSRLFADRRGSATIMDYPTCPPEVPVRGSSMPEILWTGSASTLFNLEVVLDRTLEVCEQEGYMLVVLGAENVSRLRKHPNLSARRWSQAAEDEALARAALGIMPLLDSPWDRGKAAYKAVRYLTAGVPCLISPVGVNADLVASYPLAVHGATDDEWTRKLRDLVRCPPSGADIEPDVTKGRSAYDRQVYVDRIAQAFEGRLG